MSITMHPDVAPGPDSRTSPIDVRKLFSFDGRIGRRAYWLTLLATSGVLVTVVLAAVLLIQSPLAIVLAIPVYIAAVAISAATTVKRLHDRGRTGWWYLVNLAPYTIVPAVNALLVHLDPVLTLIPSIASLIAILWLFIECGFLRGDNNENWYGHPNSGSPFQS